MPSFKKTVCITGWGLKTRHSSHRRWQGDERNLTLFLSSLDSSWSSSDVRWTGSGVTSMSCTPSEVMVSMCWDPAHLKPQLKRYRMMGADSLFLLQLMHFDKGGAWFVAAWFVRTWHRFCPYAHHPARVWVCCSRRLELANQPSFPSCALLAPLL